MMFGQFVKRISGWWTHRNDLKIDLASLALKNGDLLLVEYPHTASEKQISGLVASMRQAVSRSEADGVSLLVAPAGDLHVSRMNAEELATMGLYRHKKGVRGIDKMVALLQGRVSAATKDPNADLDYFDAEWLDTHAKLLAEAKKFAEEENDNGTD